MEYNCLLFINLKNFSLKEYPKVTYNFNFYRKNPLLVPGVQTFSKANFDEIKLQVTQNQ